MPVFACATCRETVNPFGRVWALNVHSDLPLSQLVDDEEMGDEWAQEFLHWGGWVWCCSGSCLEEHPVCDWLRYGEGAAVTSLTDDGDDARPLLEIPPEATTPYTNPATQRPLWVQQDFFGNPLGPVLAVVSVAWGRRIFEAQPLDFRRLNIGVPWN